MLRADGANVTWDAGRKCWTVRVQIGEEVIRRSLSEASENAPEEALRSMAVATAKDEGYEVDPAKVAIAH